MIVKPLGKGRHMANNNNMTIMTIITSAGNKATEMLAVMDHVFPAGFASPQVDFQRLLNKWKPLAACKVGN